jgi:anti-sigma regulatory factor (Ser/Thr protein kinase)
MSTADVITITLRAQRDALLQGMAFVVAYATAAGLPPKRVAEIELATEEALVNICRYAYVDRVGKVEIRCLRDQAQYLWIEFIDTGRPFNMAALPPPDLPADVEARPVGGLGVLLMRAMVDSVTYCREGDRNILRLAVRLPH